MIIGFSVAGSVLFEILMSITVVKAEITPESMILVVAFAAFALTFFLAFHLALTRLVALIPPRHE